jgi:CheY-like chemotaxis protein
MTQSASGTVAVLDDNLLFSSSVTAGLKRLGYTPLLLDSAKGAAERIAAAQPVAILVNLASLGWDSTDLVRSLKSEPALAGVPLAGYTGHTDVARIEAARAAGCDLVVANSAISSDLPSVLRRALDPRSSRHPDSP